MSGVTIFETPNRVVNATDQQLAENATEQTADVNDDDYDARGHNEGDTTSDLDPDRYVFFLKTECGNSLYNMLKAINFRDFATILVTDEGMKFVVDEASCVQATVQVEKNLFKVFSLKEETVQLKLNLTMFCECINVFGSPTVTPPFPFGGSVAGSGPAPGAAASTSSEIASASAPPIFIHICYEGDGYPVRIFLVEDGVLVKCSVKTVDPEEVFDFDFSPANVLNKVIMRAESLRETFGDMDTTSDVLEIRMSLDAPNLKFATYGQIGVVETEYPKDSDVIMYFMSAETQVNKYRLNLIKPSVRALALANKVSIRIDLRGFLCLQYLTPIPELGDKSCFVSYFCAPEETLMNDDDGSQTQ